MKALFALALCGLLYFGSVEKAAAQAAAPVKEYMVLAVNVGDFSNKIWCSYPDGKFIKEKASEYSSMEERGLDKEERALIVARIKLNALSKAGWTFESQNICDISGTSIRFVFSRPAQQ